MRHFEHSRQFMSVRPRSSAGKSRTTCPDCILLNARNSAATRRRQFPTPICTKKKTGADSCRHMTSCRVADKNHGTDSEGASHRPVRIASVILPRIFQRPFLCRGIRRRSSVIHCCVGSIKCVWYTITSGGNQVEMSTRASEEIEDAHRPLACVTN